MRMRQVAVVSIEARTSGAKPAPTPPAMSPATAPGAVAGLVAGGVGAGLAPLVRASIDTTATWRILIDYPAAWSVPLGFGVTIAVSLATRSRIPTCVWRTMVRLHTPEGVSLDRG